MQNKILKGKSTEDSRSNRRRKSPAKQISKHLKKKRKRVRGAEKGYCTATRV